MLQQTQGVLLQFIGSEHIHWHADEDTDRLAVYSLVAISGVSDPQSILSVAHHIGSGRFADSRVADAVSLLLSDQVKWNGEPMRSRRQMNSKPSKRASATCALLGLMGDFGLPFIPTAGPLFSSEIPRTTPAPSALSAV